MSKSTKTKSPAAPQAKKTAAPKKAVVKKAAAKKTVAPAKSKSVVKKTAVKKTSAPKKATPKSTAPTKKKTAAKKKAPVSKTIITAKIDIDFGNTLYLRGDGPGLSWDVGVPMNSVSADEWSVTLSGATSQIIFKFLVNDISWNVGDDYVVDPGSDVTLAPAF